MAINITTPIIPTTTHEDCKANDDCWKGARM